METHLNGLDRLLSGRVGPLLGHGQVALDDGGQRGDVGRLAHVPVLEQPLLGHVGLLEVDAQLQVLKHDLKTIG